MSKGAGAGAIDIGGTKMEARLFGPAMEPLESRRIPTPQSGYEDFMDSLAGLIGWIGAEAGQEVPIGLSIAGTIDPATGVSLAANLPVSGRNIGAGLRDRLGRGFPIVNDCMAFAWSEAHGGAGEGARTVAGLILGTGMAAGLCIDGAFPHRHGGLAAEIGHLPLGAPVAARWELPVLPCGCGRSGCLERYVSGPGLARIASTQKGSEVSPDRIAPALAGGEGWATRAMEIWADCAADALSVLHLTLDPDIIVLGGGLSKLPGIETILTRAMASRPLGGAALPRIALARHGDASGARGAALIARAGAAPLW
ncbi:MAG: ROK family protein [Paracoccus sp. (in: a-proteobacteria)]|nr:ROK family protein [Paracoccus sp. (in: a-proteobacteria)]